MSLQLSVIPSNAQATVNLSWVGSAPGGIIEYLIFYYQDGLVRVKTVSTTTLSTVIPNLTNGVIYNFRATAFLGGYSNGTQLTGTSMAQVVCCTQPDAPTNLAAVVSTTQVVINQQISLSWTASFSNASHPVLYYKIYLTMGGSTSIVTTSDAATSYNLTGLVNGQSYAVQIAGVNLVGEGSKCSSVSATPLGLAGVPTNVVINFDANASNSGQPGYQSVELSYTPPTEHGGTSITGYNIIYSLDSSFVSNVTTVHVAGSSDVDIQDASLMIPFADRLTNTGWFYFKVCAINSVGQGPYTTAVTLVAEVIPNAVSSIAASNLDGNGNHAPSTVTLSWSYDIDNSTPLLGYIIAYLEVGGNDMESIYVNDSSRSPRHTISGLQNGSSYDFSVFAINMLGAGPSMNVLATPSTIPDAPVMSLVHQSQAMSLSWAAPYDEGNAITGYKIYRSIGSTYTLIRSPTASTFSFNDTGLSNGTVYYYKISAVNGNGEGATSDIVHEYPSETPSAPTNIAITNSNLSGSGEQLTVSWHQVVSDIPSNGGSIVQQFIVVDTADSAVKGVVTATGASDYSFTVANLVNGKPYTFRVRSENRDGLGSYSNSVQMAPSGLPDAPSGLSIVSTTSGTVVISINSLNVASNGTNVHPSNEGSAFDHFQIYIDGSATELFTGTSHTVHGLVNGQQYSVKVSAVNGNGEGSQSSAVNCIPSTIPDAVTGLTAVHGNQSVALTWDLLAIAPSVNASNEGSAITNYMLSMSSDGGSHYDMVAVMPSTVSTTTVHALTNGSQYSFNITAFNARGDTTCTAVSAVPSTSPSAVRNTHIVANASELHVIWDKPSDVGGVPSGGLAYLYHVTVTDQMSGDIVSVADGLTVPFVEVQNLATNHVYSIAIYAYNNVDTNYIVYTTQTNTTPTPVEITSLAWDSGEAGTVLTWDYNSDVFAAIDFLMVIMDVTTGVFSSVFVPAYNAVDNETITYNQNGSYSYAFAVTHLNTETLSLASTDRLKVMIFARNADGISPMSNVVQVR